MTYDRDSTLVMHRYAAILLLCMQTLNPMHGLETSHKDTKLGMSVV